MRGRRQEKKKEMRASEWLFVAMLFKEDYMNRDCDYALKDVRI